MVRLNFVSARSARMTHLAAVARDVRQRMTRIYRAAFLPAYRAARVR